MLLRKLTRLSFVLITFAIATAMLILNYPEAVLANNPIDVAWIEKASQLQRELDLNAPLNEATFIGTHNSYNAKSYEIPLERYIDPNQTLSITDQLNNGIRSIEFDAHWTFNEKLQKDILLCHGTDNHTGCSIFDRKLVEGLKELNEWLKANPKEIILLYVEKHLDGHESQLATLLNSEVGEYIYKPSILRKKDDQPNCMAIPNTLTKANILAAGKQLLVLTQGCDNMHSAEENNDNQQNWNDIVFTGVGDIPTKPYYFMEAKINNSTSVCSESTVFTADSEHSSLWRIYEDRTNLSKLEGPQKKLEAPDMRELMRCGINWPSIDKLQIADLRMNAAIWSWTPSYPQAGLGKCAIYKKDVGIQNRPCTKNISGLVCRQEKSHQLKIISLLSTWTNGETNCQLFGGKEWHFSTPANGYQLEHLKIAMQPLLLQEVWLNYTEDTNGHWKAVI